VGAGWICRVVVAAIVFQLAIGTLQFARMILLPPHTSKTLIEQLAPPQGHLRKPLKPSSLAGGIGVNPHFLRFSNELF
jgi:hypothetical protein